MNQPLPMADDAESFDEVTHQGKTIKVGDTVIVPQAGQQVSGRVSRIFKKQDHYWVGYKTGGPDADEGLCPWPLARPA